MGRRQLLGILGIACVVLFGLIPTVLDFLDRIIVILWPQLGGWINSPLLIMAIWAGGIWFGLGRLAQILPQITPPPDAKIPPHDPHRLEWRLYLLLHGNKDVVGQLLTQLMITHPGKSKQWYLEKLIADLEKNRYR